MAATSYAAVVSLMQTIGHIMEHGRGLFALNQQQILSIHETAAFLADFLEWYSHGDGDEVVAFVDQIADAAHAAEDLIETKVVDFIHQNGSTSLDEIRSNPLCPQMQEVIEGMDLTKRGATKIKEKGKVKLQKPRDSIPSTSSSYVPDGKGIMVGRDDDLIKIMDRLTRQQSGPRQIIPISGMGGIGKTTLTRNLYETPYIVQHFDIRAWVTISQQYEIKEILSSLLIQFKVPTEGMDESQLGERIHKYLFGRRYLIVLDDMWSVDVWEKIQRLFPDNSNGSGIIVSTRLSNLFSGRGTHGHEVNFLDEDQSWNLLYQKVFGQQECPPKLKEIGKGIANNCRGLPLAIVVIAGILAKSNMTPEEWFHVAEESSNLSSFAKDDGGCMNILRLSYDNLPIHLKPCFLYMAVFPEDHEIYVSRLIKLWVAEGFLKSNNIQSLEEVAEEYLIDLIERNLVMVHKLRSNGKIKICKLHDLLGDLCLIEAEKEKFMCVIGGRGTEIPQALHKQRRIVVDGVKNEETVSAYFSNQGAISASLLHSITFNILFDFTDSYLFSCRLLRVINTIQLGVHGITFNLVNLRYLRINCMHYMPLDSLPPTLNLLWNLQTLITEGSGRTTYVSSEIWEVKQLRHLDLGGASLPEDGGGEDSILKHLQTLSVWNLKCCEGVLQRIPNIKKLGITYANYYWDLDGGEGYNCLSNLQRLHKLESLYCSFEFFTNQTLLPEHLIYPHSLKKLVLRGSGIPWSSMTIIGCLPNLQVLKLSYSAMIGEEWNPIEEQFISLKYLQISGCDELKVWNAESIHFPVLEKLILRYMRALMEIPTDIGNIETLQCIELYCCHYWVLRSAITILDMQEDLGNDKFQLKVTHWRYEIERLQNLEVRKRENLKLIFLD